MKRAWLDPRVWGPALVAAVCFAFRMQPPPAAAVLPTPHVVELPAVHGAPPPKADTEYELDAERSSVRFLVEGNGDELLASCPNVSGRLVLRAKAETSELELHLDLGSLVPIGEPKSTIDLRRLLGVHRGSEVAYRATLLRSSTSNLPGVTERLWLGTLRLGSRLTRQPMQLWQSSLLGQPLRLQGHGSVDTADYGLPPRSWLGILKEQHVVTLGLDLAWKRRASR